MDLLLTSVSEEISDITTGCCAGCSYHAFTLLRTTQEVKSESFILEKPFPTLQGVGQQNLLGSCPKGQESREELGDL